MLYRFQIELSDVDRNIYETLDFRAALHPSEASSYLLSRALAFVLSHQEGIEFSPGGLGDPEAPALRILNLRGEVEIWIEIGSPSARKLHKASKTAKTVRIYTYKNPEVLLNEIRTNDVHRASDLEIFAFDHKFLDQVASKLEKNNRWNLLVQQGQLDLTIGDETFTSQMQNLKA